MGGSGLSYKKPLHILAVVLLGFLVYSNTFGASFVFDDSHTILQNSLIRDLSNIPYFFAGVDGPFASRPLIHTTNALNYHFGGFSPGGYHAVNLALHLLNCALLYFLIVLTGKRLEYGEENTGGVALLSSFLFAVHPVQTEAVTNIINRSMLLAATFCFLGLIIFLKAATSEKRRGLYTAALFVVSLLGMASRENFVSFPIMLVLYDLFFISNFRTGEMKGHYRAYLPVAISLAYLVYLVHHSTYDTVTPTLAGLTPHDYVLTQLNVHWTYLRLLILPFNQTLDYAYPHAKTFLELPSLLSAMGYLGLWVSGIALARKRPVASFGILWFLILLLPISFGVAFLDIKLDDVIFEHRLYLPGAGIIVASACGAVILYGRYARARKVVIALSISVILTFSVATYARNEVWQSEISLWQDVIEKAPEKVRGYNNLGYAYEQERRLDKAIEYYQRALGPEMSPAPPFYLARVHFNIAHAYELTGQLEKEMEHTTIGIMLNRPTENPYSTTGDDYLRKGAVDEAIKYYLMAVASDPYFAPARYGLGNAYRAKGFEEKAAEEYAQAIKLNPGYAEAHINLGIIYKASGRLDKAIEHYSRAISIRPDSPDAHYNIGNAYLLSGQVESAIEHYKHATSLRPDDPAIHKNLAVAYRQSGMPEKAREHLRIAEGLEQK
jgi:tetratricopeptide (TPR) repeat protein